MTIPSDFDEIRPYAPEELPGAFEKLIADENFRHVVAGLFPDTPFEILAERLRQCQTNQQVQKVFFYPLLKKLVENATHGITFDHSTIEKAGNKRYTFISNHRDIVLDSAFLSYLLIDAGFPCTVEIAIGDNLLITPWIKTLVRINKSFIVQRSLSMRQFLESSMRMSNYMHFAINQKNENIWIAQREGRAKDSNDRTQSSLIKMMVMGGEGSQKERLADLHIVPLSISYEYDPCDYLKAKEFQQKRDNQDFRKSPADDLLNMKQGIFGFKGHVHYCTGTCLDEWLKTLPDHLSKTDFFNAVSQRIDEGIHRNYRLYPGNYVAADLLENGKRFASRYTTDERNTFEAYLTGQVGKIELPNKDEAYLRRQILQMYANPLYNHMDSLENKDFRS